MCLKTFFIFNTRFKVTNHEENTRYINETYKLHLYKYFLKLVLNNELKVLNPKRQHVIHEITYRTKIHILVLSLK